MGKVLLKFAVPATLSLFVAELYNMVDTMFVGRVVGASGIGALIVAFPIQRLVIAISSMIAIGASTSVARSSGEEDYVKMKAIVQNAISLAIILILPTIVVILYFKDTIIMHLGASSATFQYANDYVTIILIGALFQCFTMVGNYIMMALGDTKVTLISTSIGAINNIIMDYILVIEFSYGVKGAAIATVISQIIAFTYTFIHFLKVKKSYNLSFKFNFKKNIWFQIITVGFTTFIIESEDGIVVAVLNNLLYLHGGDFGITILGIISKISMFMYITVIGISSSMQPIAAYNFGAGDYKRLREVVKKTIIAIVATSLVVWGVAMIFPEAVIGIFIQDQNIIKESAKAFKIMIAAYPFLGIYYVVLYYNQAVGRAKMAFGLSICKQLLMVIPLSFIFIVIFNMGPTGVWISYPISDIAVFALSILLLKKWRIRMNLRIDRKLLSNAQILEAK